MSPEPKSEAPACRVITGGVAVDDRGEVAFVNDFNPLAAGVKRFYAVRNHERCFVRAWHAHRREAKYVTVVHGAAIVAAVRIDDWNTPAKDQPVQRFVLSAVKPAVVCVPPGYANGFKTLTEGAVLLFFSTATLEESQGDDVRYPATYWDPWQVECR
jgi:dTDP-4-dehydrorhamnose 3,5-epimerase